MAFWEWAAAGAVFVAMVVFCVRRMKRGLTTLEDERAECLERIRQMEEKIKEDQKNMASSEHLRVARAGLEDLLRLAGNPPGMRLESLAQGQGEARGEALVLHLPEGEVRIHATNHHVWKKVRVGRARQDGQFDIVWESPNLIEPNPFPKGYQ